MEKITSWREELHGQSQAVSSGVHDAFRDKYFKQQYFLIQKGEEREELAFLPIIVYQGEFME